MSFDNGGFIDEENEPQKINQNDQIGEPAAMENEFYYDGNVHVKSGTNRIVRKRKSKKKQLIQRLKKIQRSSLNFYINLIS